jgi:hypothetical protein
MPRGVISKSDLANVPLAIQEKVTEDVARGWYENGDDQAPVQG